MNEKPHAPLALKAPVLDRRAFLAGAGGIAGLASLPGCAPLSDAVSSRGKTELELTNERLVTQFCLDWSTMDADHLAEYLDDDIVYMMFEGRPDIIGKQAFIDLIAPFFTTMQRVEWKMLDSKVIGDLVINERIDHFYAKNPKRSMHFGIAGFFLVRNGKIKIWRDYNMPGGLRKLGPLDSEAG